jgi:hypothetical protein
MKLLLFLNSLFLVFIGHLFRGKRFNIIIDEKNLSNKITNNSIAVGYIFNSILPIRLGELVRAIIISKNNIQKFTNALSAIIIERIFDGIFIILLVPILYIFSQKKETLIINLILPYLVLIILFFLTLFLLISTPNFAKSVILKIFSKFSDEINIHFYRFIFKTVNILKMQMKFNALKKLLIISLMMWSFYILAYISLVSSLQQSSVEGMLDLLNNLFTFSFVDKDHEISYSGINLTIFLLVPPIFIIIFSQIKYRYNSKSNSTDAKETNGIFFSNFETEHHFYDSYFRSRNREFYLNYKKIFEGCEIISDESGSSGAFTAIIKNNLGRFHRKYAFGEHLESLRNQLTFLQNTKFSKFVSIESFKVTNSIVSFDMEYKDECVPLYKACEYVSNDKLFKILENIFTDIFLQCSEVKNSPEVVSNYVKYKISNNIALGFEYYSYFGIDVTSSIVINGTKYPPVQKIMEIFKKIDFEEIFCQDLKVYFHGDLTLENIIWDPNVQSQYYLIDPNLSQIFNSLECEIGKIYQSLKFNYEHYKSADITVLSSNNYKFTLNYSDKYSKMKNHLDDFLLKRLTDRSRFSVQLHSLVHLLRIFPYVKNDHAKRDFLLIQLIIGIQNLNLSQ